MSLNVLEAKSRHGEFVWLEASYNPIHNIGGELYKVVKFATDITEQVLQEQSMAQAAHLASEVSKRDRNADNSGPASDRCNC
ncbi:hypothetical protein P4S64_03260 [Vibrio sp. M60_M31a]